MYRFKCKECGSHKLVEQHRSVREVAVHSVENGCPLILSGESVCIETMLVCLNCGAKACRGDESRKLLEDGWLEKLPNHAVVNFSELPQMGVRMPNGNIRKVTNWDVMSVLLGPEEAALIRKTRPGWRAHQKEVAIKKEKDNVEARKKI